METVVATHPAQIVEGQKCARKSKRRSHVCIKRIPDAHFKKFEPSLGCITQPLGSLTRLIEIAFSQPVQVGQKTSETDKKNLVTFAQLRKETFEENSDSLQRIVFPVIAVSRCRVL